MKKAKIEYITPVGLVSGAIFFVFSTREEIVKAMRIPRKMGSGDYMTLKAVDRLENSAEMSINVNKIEFIGPTSKFEPPKRGAKKELPLADVVKNNNSPKSNLPGRVLIVEGTTDCGHVEWSEFNSIGVAEF